jgi:hypothetical protein
MWRLADNSLRGQREYSVVNPATATSQPSTWAIVHIREREYS